MGTSDTVSVNSPFCGGDPFPWEVSGCGAGEVLLSMVVPGPWALTGDEETLEGTRVAPSGTVAGASPKESSEYLAVASPLPEFSSEEESSAGALDSKESNISATVRRPVSVDVVSVVGSRTADLSSAISAEGFG